MAHASTSALPELDQHLSNHAAHAVPSTPLELLERAKSKIQTLIDGGDIDSRPSRQGKEKQKVGACIACRQAKAKCTGEPGVTCPRCLSQPGGEACVYPTFSKRGRKRGMTPNAILLDAAHSDLELLSEILANLAMNDALSPNSPHPPAQAPAFPPPAHPSPSFSNSNHSSCGSERPQNPSAGLATILESPLAILAHISSLEEADDQGTDDEGMEVLGNGRYLGQKKALPERYFAGGLYRSRYDSDPSMDPINRGLLSEADLARLVALYFHSLYPLCWHLNPEIHSVRFLRDVSPFLTTVVAYQAAGFCPVSGHLVQPLFTHVMALAERNFSHGIKSLEIVQAYCLLLHWQPLAKSSSKDRQWSWLTMALSVATEIRLERPLDEATYLHYAHVTPLPENSFGLLSDDRRRTWIRLFGAEIATCVETGRLSALTESSLFEDQHHASNRPLEPNDPDYSLNAMKALNVLYANALTRSSRMRESDDAVEGQARDEFNLSWQTAVHEWKTNWPYANAWPKLVCQHAYTILLAVSLRFKGPASHILDLCKASALEVVRMAVEWPDSSLRFANNFIVVNIAYAATMVLRLSGRPTPGTRVHLDEEVRQISYQVADVLQRISDTRLHSASLATLHAARIRSLVAQLSTDGERSPKLEPDLTHMGHSLSHLGPQLDTDAQYNMAPDWAHFAVNGNGVAPLIGAGPGEMNGEMVWPDLFHYDSMFRYGWTGNGSGAVESGHGHEFGGSWV